MDKDECLNQEEGIEELQVGMQVPNEREAYNLYNEYAFRRGFSIRKGNIRRSMDGTMRQRSYMCSKEGFHEFDDRCEVNKVEKLDTRTGCKAGIRFTVEHGVWEITYFNPEHNHQLAKPEERHNLRSGRNLSGANADVLVSRVGAGLRSANMSPCLTKAVGGATAVGLTRLIEASGSLDSGQECLEGMDKDEFPVSINQEEGIEELKVGMQVHSEHEAYNMYNEYAFRKGFSIRKGNIRRSLDGTMRQRSYLCSKEGFGEFEDRREVNKVEKLESRTGCKASIRFTVEDGVWTVACFNPEHNHQLAKPEERHNLRSGRNLPGANAAILGSRVGAGLRSANMSPSLAKAVSGAPTVGLTRQDCSSYLHTTGLNMAEAGDWQIVINHFKQKQIEDPMFFYTFQVDQDHRIKNLFWRDGISKLDYHSFGDVVVFDATYRITRYNIICALFFGVNHHCENVLFSCAFLLDESVVSFTWLFETFLESMGKRRPKTIFTNQCQAVTRAIEMVLPKTRHCLCLWHILKDAKEHLASYYENPEFKKQFNKCLQSCLNEMEFQSAWNDLIQCFNLGNNNWLQTLYELREKWCQALNLGTFSANFKSGERSESANCVFHPMLDRRMNLIKYVHRYEEMAEHMRSKELEEDFHCKKGPPPLQLSVGLLKHAADVYTVKVFKLFEKEFLNTLGVRMDEVGGDGTVNTYNLIEDGCEISHVVQLNSFNCSIECNCKMFESMGLLCRHALRVLNLKNYSKIPAQYILKRWTKGAKTGMVAYNHGELSHRDEKSAVTLRLSELMHAAFTVYSKSAMSVSTTKIAYEKLFETLELVEKGLTNSNVVGGFKKAGDESVLDICTGYNNDMHLSFDETSLSDDPCVRSEGLTICAGLKSKARKKQKQQALEDTDTVSQRVNHVIPGKNHQPTSRGSHPSYEATNEAIHNPAFFHPSFHHSGAQMGANFHQQMNIVYSHSPPTHQDLYSTWVFGHPNIHFTSNDQMQQSTQDSSRSSAANHTSG